MKKKTLKTILFFSLLIYILVGYAYAHSGRTDANGGHYDRSTGEYHYHNDGTTSYGNELIIEDDNDSSSSWYEYKINRLNDNLESKQNTIDKLNKEIKELKQKIEDTEVWNCIFIGTIIGLTIYIYYIKNK